MAQQLHKKGKHNNAKSGNASVNLSRGDDNDAYVTPFVPMQSASVSSPIDANNAAADGRRADLPHAVFNENEEKGTSPNKQRFEGLRQRDVEGGGGGVDSTSNRNSPSKLTANAKSAQNQQRQPFGSNANETMFSPNGDSTGAPKRRGRNDVHDEEEGHEMMPPSNAKHSRPPSAVAPSSQLGNMQHHQQLNPSPSHALLSSTTAALPLSVQTNISILGNVIERLPCNNNLEVENGKNCTFEVHQRNRWSGTALGPSVGGGGMLPPAATEDTDPFLMANPPKLVSEFYAINANNGRRSSQVQSTSAPNSRRSSTAAAAASAADDNYYDITTGAKQKRQHGRESSSETNNDEKKDSNKETSSSGGGGGFFSSIKSAFRKARADMDAGPAINRYSFFFPELARGVPGTATTLMAADCLEAGLAEAVLSASESGAAGEHILDEEVMHIGKGDYRHDDDDHDGAHHKGSLHRQSSRLSQARSVAKSTSSSAFRVGATEPDLWIGEFNCTTIHNNKHLEGFAIITDRHLCFVSLPRNDGFAVRCAIPYHQILGIEECTTEPIKNCTTRLPLVSEGHASSARLVVANNNSFPASARSSLSGPYGEDLTPSRRNSFIQHQHMLPRNACFDTKAGNFVHPIIFKPVGTRGKDVVPQALQIYLSDGSLLQLFDLSSTLFQKDSTQKDSGSHHLQQFYYGRPSFVASQKLTEENKKSSGLDGLGASTLMFQTFERKSTDLDRFEAVLEHAWRSGRHVAQV